MGSFFHQGIFLATSQTFDATRNCSVKLLENVTAISSIAVPELMYRGPALVTFDHVPISNRLQRAARQRILQIYRDKRQTRNFGPRVCYPCRSLSALRRPRGAHGEFAKKKSKDIDFFGSFRENVTTG